jgi:glycosyltransferase involved in cell wall biosynthesis
VHIREIIKAFQAEGHTVHLVSVPGANPLNSSHSQKKKTAKHSPIWNMISQHAPQTLFEALGLAYNAFQYFQCLHSRMNMKIDFIYERYALNSFAGVLFANHLGVPLILEVNDSIQVEQSRRYKHVEMVKHIEDWIFNQASHVLTVSSKFRDVLIESGVPFDKCSYLPNAANLDVFNPDRFDGRLRQKLGIADKVVIGFVGSFALWHGIESIAQSIGPIIEQAPQAHFLLVGHGVRFESFQAQINRLKLDQVVTLTGRVPPEKIPEYLSAIDIGLIPHSNQHGSPMKLFEYMAMGAVPVVPDLPPIRDIVKDEETALLFPTGDNRTMQDKIIRLIKDTPLRERLSAAVKRKIIEHHTWKHNAKQILAIYDSLKNK